MNCDSIIRTSNRDTRTSRGMRHVHVVAAVLLAIGLVLPGLRLYADDDAPGGDDAATAANRAVRLSYVEGDVHLSQGGKVLADQALANTPLFEGSQVVTGSDGQAEIQFEDGSIARISPESSLALSVLRGGGGSDRDTEVQLNGGLGYFEVQGDDNGHTRVRFGDSVVTVSGFTVLRVSMDKQPGSLAVFSGNAHLEGAGGLALDLHGGESVALNANDPNGYNIAESIEPDSWDTWNSDRDQAMTSASAGRTPATSGMPDSGNPAWNDLDANGNWYNVPDQGYVWSPYEASSPTWDPYGSGSWMSEPGYGYTWISAEPWGYLPYQCGAWNYYNSFGWGWAPGVCQPWWGGVGGVWAINIGVAPPRYRFPIRPTRPHNPRPGNGVRAVGPAPIVPVNRRLQSVDAVLPSRDRNTPVTIAGNVVHPVRPVEVVRMPYNHSVPAFQNRPVPPGSGMFPANNRSGYIVDGGPANRPGAPAGTIMRPSSGASFVRPAPPPHISVPPPAFHPSAPPAAPVGGGAHPAPAGPHR